MKYCFLIIALVSSLLLYSCGSTQDINQSDNGSDLDLSVKPSTSDKPPRTPDDSSSELTAQGSEGFAHPENLYTLDEEIIVAPYESGLATLKFSNVSFSISDSLPAGVTPGEIYTILEDETINADGELKNKDKYSFYTVDLTIANLSDTDDRMNLNGCKIVFMDDQGRTSDVASLRYRSGYQPSDSDPFARQYAEAVFSANRSENFRLIFIAQDDFISGATQIQFVPASTRNPTSQAFILQ
jgi:hypothetical protein